MRKSSHRELKPLPQTLQKGSAGLPSGSLSPRHADAATGQEGESSMLAVHSSTLRRNLLRSQGVGQQTLPFKPSSGWTVMISYGTASLPDSKDLQILQISAALDSSSVQKPVSDVKSHTSLTMIFIMFRICTFEIHPQVVCTGFT